ncbi:MAG: ABC transporter ATP-binding protein [Myxococcales bacterium]|nr:ABC transporter ATP-binding protein [Myxococcales bacterium]
MTRRDDGKRDHAATTDVATREASSAEARDRTDASSSASDFALLRRLGPFMRPQALLYIVSLVAAPLSALVVITQPYLLKLTIDGHITKGDIGGTERLALLYLGAVIAAWLLESAYQLSLSYAATRTIASLRAQIYAHTIGLARGFFDRHPKGQLLTRATSDIEALGETLTAGAVTIILDVIKGTGILVAMFLLDWRLTLVMLLVSPIVFLVVNGIRRILRKLFAIVRTSLAALNAFTAERLNGIEVVQLYSDEARALREYRKRLDEYRRATVQTNIWDSMVYAVIDGLTSVTMALMLWYGTGSAFGGVITAGLLAAFIDYVAKLFQPIQEFSGKLALIQRASSALEKIFGLLDTDERVRSGDDALTEPRGVLRLRDVHFAYGDGPDVLRGVELDLNPGEVVAVVGRTGSGKTTLGRLLTCAYDDYRGSIELDGHELSALRVDHVRRTIGTVEQDVRLFPGSVRFNLSLGREVDDERLTAVVEMSRATETIERLGGLDGEIEHAGQNLSVGEAQLLSIARTMAHDAPIVIFDEATANVDSLTEQKIQEATDTVLQQKTVLVIAHRLSTIINATRIAVMDAGRVVECGTHDELMGRGGAYARLFQDQFDADSPSSWASSKTASSPLALRNSK